MLGFSQVVRRPSSRIANKGEKKLKIICVEENRILLGSLMNYVRAAISDAQVFGFDNAEEAVGLAKNEGCDILLTEIELYGKPSGIEAAREIQKGNPRVNIIFTTVCSQKEYAEEVIRIRPSAYLTKVVTQNDVERALGNLLYSVG